MPDSKEKKQAYAPIDVTTPQRVNLVLFHSYTLLYPTFWFNNSFNFLKMLLIFTHFEVSLPIIGGVRIINNLLTVYYISSNLTGEVSYFLCMKIKIKNL